MSWYDRAHTYTRMDSGVKMVGTVGNILELQRLACFQCPRDYVRFY